MVIKKQGFPKDGEIVLCTVKRIQKTTVFITLDEYEGSEGIIHISEISPGRIRTLRDFVKEGKKIVCKVLRKNERYGNLDLSLRRVTTGQKLLKLKEAKLEQKCEKIIESIAKQQKKDFKALHKTINEAVLKEYDSIAQAFQEIAEHEESSLTEVGIEKKLAHDLEEIIRARLKPQAIKLSKVLVLTCPDNEGIEVIKESLKKAMAFAKKKEYQIETKYISAPRYSISITTADPKQAEVQMEEVTSLIHEEIKKAKGTFELEKAKK